MKDDIKISRKTKSSAYRFIKSLMNDGAEGDDIHNLVSAISDNVSAEIGGEILSDLIRNAKDENAEEHEDDHWFGPVSHSYYAAIADAWANMCEDAEIRGHIRIGGIDAWKSWNKQGGQGYDDDKLKERASTITPQIICFNWTADAIVSNEIHKKLNGIHDQIKAALEKEKEEDKYK